MVLLYLSLREKCPYSKLFWSVFSRIRTEYGQILRIFPYSDRMRENTDQNNSEYGHFLRSVLVMSHVLLVYWMTGSYFNVTSMIFHRE